MNKLWSLPPTTIARRALLESWQQFFDGNNDNWCGRLHGFLSSVGVQPAASLSENPLIPLYDERLVVDILRGRRHKVYLDLAAAAQPSPYPASKLVSYHAMFADRIDMHGPKWKRAKYLNMPLSLERVKLFARFRLANHFLAIEIGRWHRPAVPAAMRLCALCGTDSVQDEYHYFFACPALQLARQRYPRLFAPGCPTHLRGMFSLCQVTFSDRPLVARDICSFLHDVGGIYAPPQGAAET